MRLFRWLRRGKADQFQLMCSHAQKVDAVIMMVVIIISNSSVDE